MCLKVYIKCTSGKWKIVTYYLFKTEGHATPNSAPYQRVS